MQTTNIIIFVITKNNLLSKYLDNKLLSICSIANVMKIQGSGKHYWMDTQDAQRVKVILIRKTAYEYFLREWEGARAG
mgnify:FL=1